MKRKIALSLTISILLTLILSIQGLFVKVEASDKEDISTSYIINSFETIYDAYKCDYIGNFGKADINKNKQFVTAGESSLYLNVHGNYVSGFHTSIKIPFSSLNDFYDISKIKNISFDFFNESKKEQTIMVALGIADKETDFIQFKLAEGKNKIKIDYNAKGLSAVYDLTKAKYITIRLPKVLNRGEESSNVYYLDNIVMEKNIIAPSPFEIYFDKTTDEYEFCSFEKAYQEFVMVKDGAIGDITGYNPITSLNKDKCFCLNETGNSLKVELPGGMTKSGSPAFTFHEKIWHNFKWEELNDYTFNFSVYNDSDSDFIFSFMIWRKPDIYSGDKYNRYQTSFTSKAHQWTEVSIPIKDWNEADKDEPLTVNNKGEANYGLPKIIYSGSSVGASNRNFYFDNFTIKKIG